MSAVPIALIAAGIVALLDKGEDPRAIIEALIAQHGARHRFASGTYHLGLGGVTVSCTAGGANLLLAWAGKARRLVEEAS